MNLSKTILPIIHYDYCRDSILRRRSVLVSDFREIQTFVDNLIVTGINCPNAVALSAPQVGHNLRIILIKEPVVITNTNHVFNVDVFVNPKIVKYSKRKVVDLEGCLSIPNTFGYVSRHKEITVETYNRFGHFITIEAEDRLARIFQHEIDHLDGILFIDRITTKPRNKKKTI